MFDQPEDTEARRRRETANAQHGLMKATLRVPDAGSVGDNITSIRDWFSKRNATAAVPPRDPTPRSPNRHAVPVRKIETIAISKHDLRLGDLLIEKIAAIHP